MLFVKIKGGILMNETNETNKTNLEKMDPIKLDTMRCGMFNNKSYWGVKSSLLKSGICKYYRREMFDKFEWCVMEMMLFGFKTKALVTNLVHRLEILLMEEIVCDEIAVIIRSVRLLEKINVCSSEIGNVEKLYEKIALVKQFCDGIKGCKKGRICSYMNCWWLSQKLEINIDDVVLDKVLLFKKEGDSEILLKYGEVLLRYIEEKDEKIFAVYNALLENENKEGMRYKRSDAVYLYWEIIEKKLVGVNANKKEVFDFAFGLFNRKTMKERKMFGVWIGMMMIKTDENIAWNKVFNNLIIKRNIEKYLSKHLKMVVDEDFVVNDWHVNKKFGLKKFAEVGAFVVNEDISILGENRIKYKAFYVEKKAKKDEEKEMEEKVVKEKVVKEKIMTLNFEENFKVVKVFDEGVCGMKKPCVLVENKKNVGELLVIKLMSKTLNYGLDYMFVDSLKEEFGLKSLEMQRIKSNLCFSLVDKSKKNFYRNWKLETGGTNEVYCVMKYFENIGDLIGNKELLEDAKVVEEMLKIRLFDGLFRSSDNNLRNIIVLKDETLLSIDEGDIFGKRKNVFEKGDWCKKSKWCTENIDRIIEEFIYGKDKKGRLAIILEKMKEFDFSNEKIKECEERFNNYKEIIKAEI